MRLSILAGLFSLLFATVAPSVAHAQNAKLRLERFGFDKLPDIKLYMTFVEEDGTIIAGKAATDFKLDLDAADQGPGNNLTTFDGAKEPIFVVGVAQISGVVNERALAEVKAGLRKINDVVSNTPGGRMGILGYAGETKRLIESGTSSEVDAALGKMAIDSEASETHMIDAVRTAIDLLKAQDKGRRKLIVLFSDGIDVNNDKKGFVDIGNRAQQAGIVIDTIGYNEFDPPKLRNLQEMAKRCYGIDRIAKTPTELGPRFDAVVDEIQKQYVITFPLSIIGDDKEHTFQVKHEAGGKPVYSNTVNEKLPSKVDAPVAVKTEKKSRPVAVGAARGGCGGRDHRRHAAAQKAGSSGGSAAAVSVAVADSGTAHGLEDRGPGCCGRDRDGLDDGSYRQVQDVTFKLKDRNVIGTAADCDIVIEDGFMSVATARSARSKAATSWSIWAPPTASSSTTSAPKSTSWSTTTTSGSDAPSLSSSRSLARS